MSADVEAAAVGAQRAVYNNIRELDLVDHVVELEELGFTIVSPERAGTSELVDPMLDAIVRSLEHRAGVRLDVTAGETRQDLPQAAETYDWLLFEDPIFEAALLNPVSLTLATFLMTTGNEPLRPAAQMLQGRVPTFQLMTHNVLVKGPGERPLHMHCDNGLIPSPFPTFQQICNTTILLTDYSVENGALCFMPGSHRWCRHPTPAERFDFEKATPVEAPRGSLVVWGGNTWHGAFPRQAPGLRVTNVFTYCREYLPSDPGDVPPEMLERNPPIFAQLMGEGAFRPSRQNLDPSRLRARAES